MIPEAFLGTHFVEAKEEHLDDFLSVRGVPWLVRKMISGKMRKGQFLMNRNPDGTYTYTTGDPSRNLQYRFNLGETFTATGYDGKQHKITISVEGDKLKEAHLNLERDIGEDVFYYFFRDGILISECEASNNGKKATWTREFVKKTESRVLLGLGFKREVAP
nr:CBN-LBP-3 protein [Haemonchus contortus]